MTVCTVALAVVLNTDDAARPASTPSAQIAQTPSAPTVTGMMAVLSDAAAQPTMLVSWPMQAGNDGRIELRVRIIMDHPMMDPNTSWQLWSMPADAGGVPRAVGLVGLEREQILSVDASMLKTLLEASGMGLSNEPPGGSPTGLPTGPMIFRGPSLTI
ncbi:MAG: anti-sigma factor [Proteobacteria bacterium]|nr:anti-sigma factor [Burkholderiales bacterium]